MKPIDHRTAQRWVNARLDGALDLESLQQLEDHLQTCPECQQYARQMLQLDAALYRQFAAQPQPVRLPDVSLPPRAAPKPAQARATMTSFRLAGALRSAAYITALMVMVGGLAFLFSNLIPSQTPGSLQPGASHTPGANNAAYPGAYPAAYPGAQGAYPYPGSKSENPYPGTAAYPKAEAYPASESAAQAGIPTPGSNALVDPTEIARQLDDLAQKNLAWQQAAGWVHSLKSSLSLPNTQDSTAVESWTHLPTGPDECKQALVYVRDQPDGAFLYQMFVQTTDGLHADLLSRRQTGADADPYPLGSPNCTLTAADTDAGTLARRLREDPAAQGKRPNQVRQAHAWEASVDGRPVWTVQIAFVAPQSAPPVQIETYQFDPQTGRLVQEFQRSEWEDGKTMGQWASGYQYQVYRTLPPEAAQEFAAAAQELHRAPMLPPTPDLTRQAPVELDGFAYTQSAPLTDTLSILGLLQALRQRQLDWLSQPGWYLTTMTPGYEAMDRAILFHTLDASGACEQLTYFARGDRQLAQQLWLSDGSWGLIGSVDDGRFTEGAAAGAPENSPCRPEKFEALAPLNGLIETLTAPPMSGAQTAARLWLQDMSGSPVVVLQLETNFTPPYPSTMDPDTKALERLTRQVGWDYLDLEHGGWLGMNSQAFLENGKVIGQPKPVSDGILRQYQSFEKLPANLDDLFQQTLAALQAYLASK